MSNELLDDDNHGNSPAAWTGVISMMIGFVFLTVSLFIEWEVGVWVGIVLIAIGVPIGFILSKLGFGIRGRSAASSQGE